jgi:serpin B
MSVTRLRNPLTGNWIQMGGITHQKLMASGLCSEGDMAKFYCQILSQQRKAKQPRKVLVPYLKSRSPTFNQDAERMPYKTIPAREPRLPIVPSSMKMFDDSINKLNVNLFEPQLITQAIVMSPFSIYCAMLMVYLGSQGETRQELQRLLNIRQDDTKVIANLHTLKTLDSVEINSSAQVGPRAQFVNSNALVVRQGYPIERTYRDLFTLVFGGDLLSFQSSREAVAKTNSWVAHQTSNLIPQLLSDSDVGNDLQLMIINTVYFKAQWAVPFKPEQTHPDIFKGFDQPMELSFMSNLNHNYRYFEDSQAQYLELLYTDTNYAFRLALPKQNQPSQLILEKLVRQVGQLNEIKFQPNFVSLSLPKFTHRKRVDLVKILKSLGVKTLFTENADLSLISKRDDLSVSKIIHEAVVKINETETEAAAATAVIMKQMAIRQVEEPIKVIADRPFFYEIIHVRRNVVLFSGIFNGK